MTDREELGGLFLVSPFAAVFVSAQLTIPYLDALIAVWVFSVALFVVAQIAGKMGWLR